MKKLSEYKINRIRKMSKEGVDQKSIADALSISQAVVNKYSNIKIGRGNKSHLKG